MEEITQKALLDSTIGINVKILLYPNRSQEVENEVCGCVCLNDKHREDIWRHMWRGRLLCVLVCVMICTLNLQ